MSGILLDTTPLTGLFQGHEVMVAFVEPWMNDRRVHITILSYGEVIEYFLGRPHFEQRKADLFTLLGGIRTHALTHNILERYALLRREMRTTKPGLIGDVDTLTASASIENGLTLVTTDRDFLRVPGLERVLLAPRTFELIERSTRS